MTGRSDRLTSAMIGAEQVERLREESGAGLVECKKALVAADGDFWLAQGIMKYDGLAIHVRPRPGQTQEQAYSAWVIRKAREHARRKQSR